MTAIDLTAMLRAADLTDTADRLELADLLEEAGREQESAVLRSADACECVRGEVREGTTVTDIAVVLAHAGAMFDGGSEASRLEIAAEWADEGFDAEAVMDWVAAGCWSVSTATELHDAGFRPGRDVLRVNDGDVGCVPDEIYALCNGDVALSALTW